MRVCVVGLGAIGSHLAATLALGGMEVSAVARGRTLERVASDGIAQTDDHGTRVANVPVSDDPSALPPPDVVLVAVKAWQLPGGGQHHH